MRRSRHSGRPVRRHAPRRPAPAFERAARSLLVALALLCAHGTTLVHLVVVRHTTCEHGELIEVAPAARPAPKGHSDHPEVVAGQHEQGHDHCHALGVRHDAPQVGAAIAASTESSILAAPERTRGQEARPIPLLSLAPKGSPSRA